MAKVVAKWVHSGSDSKADGGRRWGRTGRMENGEWRTSEEEA